MAYNWHVINWLITYMSLSPILHQDRAQHGLLALMSHTARLWRRVIDQQLQPLGLSEATWLPLLHLSRAIEPMRQKDLAFALSLDSSSVVRLLDALETAGLVERREGADRRAKTIHLTGHGASTVAQVEQQVGATRQRFLAAIPAAQLDAALGVVQQLSTALAAELERAP